MKIYVYTPFAKPHIQKLREVLSPKYKIIVGEELPTEQREVLFKNCEICFGNPPLSWLNGHQHLQWIQLNSAGLDPYQKLTDFQFKMTNLKGFFGQSVAETALAGILGIYRRIDHFVRLQTEKQWIGKPVRATMQLLHHSKVLILGGGAIGQKTEKLLSGFDCETTVLNSKTIHQLADYLPDTDILIVALPETKETIGLLNKEYLSMLKPSALFVNVGRGSLVDEPFLIELLVENKIMGAVLDVTAQEPLPLENPLWELPNVLLTQHTSGGWANEGTDKITFFLENLKRFENGEELVNNVDLVKGY